MQSSVYIAPVGRYEDLTVEALYLGIKQYSLVNRCKGKTVLLKPNLVEYASQFPINTDPYFLGLIIELYRELGAARIIVAEGPGHRRDTLHLLYQTGIAKVLADRKVDFLDLNVSHILNIPNLGGFTDLPQFYIGGLAQSIDIIVSLPKLKTHHFTGLTASLKNLMGMAAGAVYGWPKNLFHVNELDKSIADLYLSIKPHFTIIDGVVAMAGNGPLHGEPFPLGAVIMAEDFAAADATCAELIGLAPFKIGFLKRLSEKGFSIERELIRQIGEPVEPLRKKIPLLPAMEIFRH